MSELDVLLRESLGRLAEPGDSTGVAEAIRARVEAAASSGDGGSGGGSGQSKFWSGPGPFAILIALSVAGGAALGASGALGGGNSEEPPAAAAGLLARGVDALACPGGATVDQLPGGTRVLATEISSDGAFVAVRDPYDLAATVWLRTGAVVVDAGQADVGSLPVAGCSQPSPLPSPSPSPTVRPVADADSLTERAPHPAPAPAPQPKPQPKPVPAPAPAPQPKPTSTPVPPPPPPPPPAPDTQKPTASAGTPSPGTVYGSSPSYAGCGSHTATVTVTASDNVGVTAVSGSADLAGVTVTPAGHSGSTWTFTVTTPAGQPSQVPSVAVHLTFVAHDAAGNASTPATTTLTYGYCLT